MNNRTLAAMALKTIETCSVIYQSANGDYPEFSKKYTFMIPAGIEVYEGEILVVKSSNGLAFVKVVEVHDFPELDPELNVEMKFIVGSFSSYEEDVESSEKEISKKVKMIKSAKYLNLLNQMEKLEQSKSISSFEKTD